MRLDLGGGLEPVPGHVNIDIIQAADVFWDLNYGLPKKSKEKDAIEIRRKPHSYLDDYTDEIIFNEVEGIRSHHLIEHLDTIIPLMNDCYQVMKKGAVMEISTPLAGTKEWYQDPTHKRAYIPETFLYFKKDSPFKKEQDEYGITARFEVETNISDEWQLEIKLTK